MSIPQPGDTQLGPEGQPVPTPPDPPRFMRCAFCGTEKPEPAVPGRERYETDENGGIILDEFCPACGRGELTAA